MKSDDKRAIWKKKSDLQLMQIILEFIEKHQVNSVRKYQQKLKEYPKEVPSIWFIKERFGSWDKLLIQLGETRFERYRWSKMTDEQVMLIATEFIKIESISSRREYDRRSVGNRKVPSLDTLKKRFDNISLLFKNQKQDSISDFQLLSELKKEIIRLNLEKSLSMTEFRKKANSEKLPSVDTIMRRTGKSWEELMAEIGYDYRTIKTEKLIKNFN